MWVSTGACVYACCVLSVLCFSTRSTCNAVNDMVTCSRAFFLLTCISNVCVHVTISIVPAFIALVLLANHLVICSRPFSPESFICGVSRLFTVTMGEFFPGGGQQGLEAGEPAVGSARRQTPPAQNCRFWLLQARNELQCKDWGGDTSVYGPRSHSGRQ